MKFIYIFFISLLFQACSKPKTVLICGDHICINKTEAKQYFEENLSLEVKIIDPNKKKELNLVELNLKNNTVINKKISIEKKVTTNQDLKVLTNKEIKEIKVKIKQRDKVKKIASKNINNKKSINKISNKNIKIVKKNTYKKEIINRNDNNLNIVDVCKIITECNIDEISKYLSKEGMRKKYPDITAKN